VFRILRFCKYLPDFGWEPIILTPRPEAVVPITLDPTLNGLIPPHLEIHRTTVFRPFYNIKARAQGLRDLFRAPTRRIGGISPVACGVADSRKAPAINAGDGLAENSSSTDRALTIPDTSISNRAWSDGLKQFLKTWESILLANPDRHVGWFVPAVREGLRIIRRNRPAVIYATGPPHSVHLIAAALKRLTGVPVILDFRDPWAAREWSVSEHPTAKQRSALRWEARCVAVADRVILNTGPVCRQFEETYGSGKFTAIPNGLDADFTQRIEAMLSEVPPANGEILLCHAGSVYGKRDLRPLAAAVEIVAKTGQRISMEQIGPVDAACRPTSRPSDPNGAVRLLGSLPHDQTLRRMAAASVLVLIQPDNRLQIPGKLYEMLPFRKPMLTLAGAGATAEVVQQYDLGPIVDSSAPEAIAQGILRASSPESRTEAARGAQRAMADFDGRTLTGRLAAEFESAVSP
jgi:glycosyltransferase involved in cell wall biosynthesis